MADQPSTAVPALWQGQATPRQLAQQAAQARRQRVVVAILVMIAFVGVLLYVLLWLTPMPDPYFTAVWVTDYQSRQITAPPESDFDRKAMQQGNYFERKSPHCFQGLDHVVYAQELGELASRSPVEAVVVYLAGRARTGPKGEVQLLPSDADPASLTSWLPLRQVLEQLKACPARSKLLVLDIMSSMADPRMGVVLDDVTRGVQLDLDAVADPERLVLCACAPAQVALASPVLARTVFSYYFEEGLRGWADGYGGHRRERRVAVRELAEFLQARVDRWAYRNRLARQTPVLFGTAADFALLVLPQGEPQPHLTEADELTYPAWLVDGWKLRQKWWADGTYRMMPSLLHELDALLLDSEQEWQRGADIDRLRDVRQRQVKNLEARKLLFKLPPQPEAFSLALAAAQGSQPDKEVQKTLGDIMAKRFAPAPPGTAAAPAKPGAAPAGPPPLDKETAAALEKLRAKPHFDVAWTAFELLAADTDPTPDKIRFLNALLQQQEARPRYVETLFMQRLGELADKLGGDPWPKDVVRRAFDAVRQGEKAASQPEVFAWVRGQLEDAAQKRYEAETILFAPGYVSVAAAAGLFRRASDGYEVCLSQGATMQTAQLALDEALAFLPADVPFVLRQPLYEKDWLAAAAAAEQLYQLLAAVPQKPLSNDELRLQGEDIRARTDALHGRLDDLRQPFSAATIGALKALAKRTDTGPFHVLELEDVLATPFLQPADRQALWKIQQSIARRLHEQTRALDEAEDAGQQSITVQFGANGDPDRQARLEAEQAARRARLSIALLRLGGLAPAEVQKLEALLQQAAKAGTPPLKAGETVGVAAGKWYNLGQDLRQVWTVRLPAQLQQDDSSSARDRLSRVFALADVGLVQPEAAATPQIQLRQAQERLLWAWLADRNRYASHDSLNLGLGDVASFYSAAARSYQQLAGPMPEDEYVQVIGSNGHIALAPATPLASYALLLRLFAPPAAGTNAVFRVLTADDAWLEVTPNLPESPPAKGDSGGVPLGLPFDAVFKLPLRIALKAGAQASLVPAPQGFLVEVAYRGRSYHQAIDVALQSVTDRVEILLSPNPKEPTNLVGDLRLRPVKMQQPFYLYLRNPTKKPRNLLVQLVSNDTVIEGVETKAVLAPHSTQRINFPISPGSPSPPAGKEGKEGAAPPAKGPAPLAELPEFRGPLEVRVLDIDNKNAILERKLMRVAVASPREYVQVIGVQFYPPHPFPPPTLGEGKGGGQRREHNLLSVGLRTLLLGGPPCSAELVLPPERIPGFLGVKDGNFKGTIPFGGEQLRLYADNIQLEEGADELGYCYVNVDEYARAFVFRTTFARGGDPTTPQEDFQPAVRIRAPRFALTGSQLPVVVETDNAPAGATLDLAIGRLENALFTPDTLRPLPAARQTRIGFNPHGPGGALLFEALYRDWSVEFDTGQIKGPRTLRARLLDASGKPLRIAMETVILDDTPPAKPRIVDAPKAHKKDVPLLLKAFCATPISGFKEVSFFIGKTPADGKLPAGTQTYPAAATDDTRSVWEAKVPLDGGKKGPTDFSVQFVSQVGLASFATVTVDLTDTDPALTAPGRIHGTVYEGGRQQTGLAVGLYDQKGTLKDETKTGADGSFTFDKVPPGIYRVYSAKPITMRKRQVDVTVQPGQTATVKLDLLVEPMKKK